MEGVVVATERFCAGRTASVGGATRGDGAWPTAAALTPDAGATAEGTGGVV